MSRVVVGFAVGVAALVTIGVPDGAFAAAAQRECWCSCICTNDWIEGLRVADEVCEKRYTPLSVRDECKGLCENAGERLIFVNCYWNDIARLPASDSPIAAE